MPKLKDVTPGTVFGQLTVLGCCFSGGKSSARCVCTCGTIKTFYLYSLGRGANSCGCALKGKLIHRLPVQERKEPTKLARTYRVWLAMWERVNSAKKIASDVEFPESWRDFNNFKQDMGLCPTDLVLDRIDVRLPYSAENCVWSTQREALMNKQGTVYYYNGKQVVHENYLSELFGYSSPVLTCRRINGELPVGWKIVTYDEVVAIRRASRCDHSQ